MSRLGAGDLGDANSSIGYGTRARFVACGAEAVLVIVGGRMNGSLLEQLLGEACNG